MSIAGSDGKGEHPHRYSVYGSHLLGRCHGPLRATSPSITPSNPFPSHVITTPSGPARLRGESGVAAWPVAVAVAVAVDGLFLAAPRRTGSRKALGAAPVAAFEFPRPRLGRPSGRAGNSRSGRYVASTEGPASHGWEQGHPPRLDPGPGIAECPPRTRTKTYFCRRTFS